MKMNSVLRRCLIATAGLALAGAAAAPAQAAGTAAGTSIALTATVNFSVSGAAKTATTANSVMVDRVINMTLTATSTTARDEVVPGTAGVATFTLTNTSNATLDFSLTAANETTDDFNATLTTWVDNGDGVYNAATDMQSASIDNLAADAAVKVWVLGYVPNTQTHTQKAKFVLTVRAFEPGTAGAFSNTALVNTTGANTTWMDTVFADGAGYNDAAADAQFSQGTQFTVKSALLTTTPTIRVISDPVNGTTSPDAMPGAVVQYCVQVQNAANTFRADQVLVRHLVPSTVTFDSTFGIKWGLYSDATVCTAGTGTGALATVGADTFATATIDKIEPNETKALLFRGTVK